MVTISKKGSRPNTFPSSRPAPSQCHVRTFQLNVKFKGGMFYVKICVAMQSRFLKLLRKERHLFCLFKTLVWMKVPLFSMKITIIFFINPDSAYKGERPSTEKGSCNKIRGDFPTSNYNLNQIEGPNTKFFSGITQCLRSPLG